MVGHVGFISICFKRDPTQLHSNSIPAENTVPIYQRLRQQPNSLTLATFQGKPKGELVQTIRCLFLIIVFSWFFLRGGYPNDHSIQKCGPGQAKVAVGMKSVKGKISSDVLGPGSNNLSEGMACWSVGMPLFLNNPLK